MNPRRRRRMKKTITDERVKGISAMRFWPVPLWTLLQANSGGLGRRDRAGGTHAKLQAHKKTKGPANRAGPCRRDLAVLLRSAAGPEGRNVALHQGYVVGSWRRIVFLGLTFHLRNLADHATTNSAGCLFQGRVGVDERVRDRWRSWILDGKE